VSAQTRLSGKAIADYFIVKSGGTAVAASFHIPSLASTVDRYQGFADEFKKCGGCSLVSDQSYGLVSQATFANEIKATMNAHPSIKWIFVDVSQYATIAATAIQGMGLAGKVGIAGVEVQSIKAGTGEVACSDDVLSEAGYPTINELTRAFAHLSAGNDAYPFRLLDQQIIDSGTTPYIGNYSPETAYKKLWGMG
jgi:ABC-type sugar transport system substrate-binding protein